MRPCGRQFEPVHQHGRGAARNHGVVSRATYRRLGNAAHAGGMRVVPIEQGSPAPDALMGIAAATRLAEDWALAFRQPGVQ